MTFPKTTGSKQGDVLGVTFDTTSQKRGRHRAKDGGRPALTLVAEYTGTDVTPRRRNVSIVKSVAPEDPGDAA